MKDGMRVRSLRHRAATAYAKVALLNLGTIKLTGITLSALLLLSACATHIEPMSTENPPPTEALANFDHFELLPVDGTPEAKKQTAAYSHVDHNLQVDINELTRMWEKTTPAGRKLEIAPYVQDLKFVGGVARAFVGAMAGSSAIVLKLKLTDGDTKAVIGEPIFYQRAEAFGGAFSMGHTDNAMLGRIGQVVADYLRENHEKAVGGPTGYAPQ